MSEYRKWLKVWGGEGCGMAGSIHQNIAEFSRMGCSILSYT
jgi:hypothetical protein